jgi:hypothetical protein
MTKANIGVHAGSVQNPLTFLQAYEQVRSDPDAVYQTTGNQTAFSARARVTRKGKHASDKAIRFSPNNEYVYECCWGHKTNCSGSHIDCYTAAIR